jgi:hypothetical protein
MHTTTPRAATKGTAPAKSTSNDNNATRIAMCHKTLFGNIDLQGVTNWAKYHHDLGFDDIFIWYIPEMANHAGFDDLANLPYVTMLVNTVGKARRSNGYLRMDRNSPGSQLEVEKWCLQEVAVDHDWVMWAADADEFFLFNQSIGVHEFVHQYEKNNTFLSFGKWMYTLMHTVQIY